MKRLLVLLSMILPGLALGQVPISALPAASAFSGAEVYPIVQSATTKKATPNQMQVFLEGLTNSWTGGNTFSNSSGVPITVNTTAAQNVGVNVVAATNTTNQINIANTGGGTTTQSVLDLSDNIVTGSVIFGASSYNSILGTGPLLALTTNSTFPILLAPNFVPMEKIATTGVTINTPSSGVPLTVNANLANNVAENVISSSNTATTINISNTGGGASTESGLNLNDGTNTGSILWQPPSYSGVLGTGPSLALTTNVSSAPVLLAPNFIPMMKVLPTGTTIFTPGTGVPLTVNANLANNVGELVTSSSNTTTQINIVNTGGGTATASAIDLQDGSTTGFMDYTASTYNGALGVGNNLTIATNTNAPIILSPNLQPSLKVTTTSITGWGPTAAGLVDMAPDKGTATGTFTGFTTTVTNTCIWAKHGSIVVMFVDVATGTSNTNTFTITGCVPAEIRPARNQPFGININTLINNGAVVGTPGLGLLDTGGTMTLGGVTWVASGTKGLQTAMVFSYLLN